MATKTRGTAKGSKYRDGRSTKRGAPTSKQANRNLIRQVVRPTRRGGGRKR